MGKDFKAADVTEKLHKLMRKVVEKDGWEGVRRVFNERDEDRDGELSYAELTAALDDVCAARR